MYQRAALFGVMMAMLVGCSPLSPSLKLERATPRRIISLDYCSDQFVLKLADRDQILALSPDATKDFSYLAEQAVGMAKVRSQAEDVLVLRPDLVVRSYGGGPGAVDFFERAGLPVAQLSYAEDYTGILENVRAMAGAFGHPERGEALVADFETRLAAIEPTRAAKPTALYATPSGVTGGQGTMIDAMIKSAGLSNFQDQAGWNPIPLERLARQRPDIVIAASFGAESAALDRWSLARHPVARAQLKDQAVLPLNGALTSCGGWFVIEAIEAMAKTARTPTPQITRP
jgi:iron complex transport system substrate-binding protein